MVLFALVTRVVNAYQKTERVSSPEKTFYSAPASCWGAACVVWNDRTRNRYIKHQWLTTNSYDTPTSAVGLSTAGATMESVPYDDIMYDSSHNTQRVNFVTYEFAGGPVVAKATSVLTACSVFFNTTTGANNPPVYDVHIISGTADLSYDGQTLKLHLNIDGAGNDDDWVGSINSDESWKLTSTRESIIENVPYVPATDTPDSVKQQYQGKACTPLG